MMKKALALLVFALSSVLAHTLTMAVSENLGALNPQGYQGNAMFAQNAVYEGLTRIDKQGRIAPSLAKSWEIGEGGRVYDFTLREGVRFHNGEVFNADAVVKNFHSILKNRARHSWSGLMNALDSVSKLGEYKVRLRLKTPYAPTLSELATPRPFRFLAPSAFPDDLDLIKHNPKPIGTGAYMLVDSKLGISDTLARNPHYWGGTPFYDEIICKVIYDPNAKLAALRAGQVELLYGQDQIPLEIFKSMQNNPRFATYMSEPLFTTSLVLNSASPTLRLSTAVDSQALRLLVAQAIDVPKLNRAVYGGLQGESLRFIKGAPPVSRATASSDELRQKIESLLATDSALKLRTTPLELLFAGDNPAQKMMAEIIQSDLAKVGLRVRLSACEPTICRNRLLKGNFDMAFNDTWGAPYEPLSLLHSMLIPSHIDYAAQSGLEEKSAIDEGIRALMRELPDSKEAQNLLSLVLGKLTQSGVYIPLTAQRDKAIAARKIKGIEMGVVGYEVPFWEMRE